MHVYRPEREGVVPYHVRKVFLHLLLLGCVQGLHNVTVTAVYYLVIQYVRRNIQLNLLTFQLSVLKYYLFFRNLKLINQNQLN